MKKTELKEKIEKIMEFENFTTYDIIKACVEYSTGLQERIVLDKASVVHTACDIIDISPSKLDNRKEQAVYARMLSYHYFRNKAKFPLKHIADMFDKNHATIIHSIKLLKNLTETNQQPITAQYQEFRNRLNY